MKRHHLRVLYSMIDTVQNEAHRQLAKHGQPVSCGEGCDSCCHLFVTVMFPEAIAIVERLRDEGRLDDFVRDQWTRLVELSERATQPGLTTNQWLEEWHACPLLVDKRCSVYEDRPTSCRFHEAVSEPALCAVPGSTVKSPDYMRFKQQTMTAIDDIASEAGLPMYMGPLPTMLLWSIILVRDGLDALRAHTKGHPADPFEKGFGALVFWSAVEAGGATFEIDDTTRSITCRLCGHVTDDREYVSKRRCPKCRADHLRRDVIR